MTFKHKVLFVNKKSFVLLKVLCVTDFFINFAASVTAFYVRCL